MKMMRWVLFAAMFAVLTGCATTSGTSGSQVLNAESADEGVIKQKTEFKDLPAELQQCVAEGA